MNKIISDIFKKHRNEVKVNCSEHHAHTAHCLIGPKDSVEICILYEEIMRLERKLGKIKKIMKE